MLGMGGAGTHSEAKKVFYWEWKQFAGNMKKSHVSEISKH